MMTCTEVNTEYRPIRPAETNEIIIKAVMVDGVTITLENENADYWLLPGAVEEMVHTFMTTGFKSLQVHPAFKRQVRAIASRQFKAAYGAGYIEREDWRRLFGADNDEADGLLSPVAIHPAPARSGKFRSQGRGAAGRSPSALW
jgi:hypothetical protein